MKQDLDISNIESKPTDSNPFQKGDAVRLKQSDGCYPRGTMFIVDGLIGNSMVIVFRGVHGVMASVDKYEKTTASAKTLRKIRKRLVSVDETCSTNIQPTGNTSKFKRPYPNRVVKSKYDAVVAERDKYKESAEINGKAAHDMILHYEKVILDIGKVTAERDRLKAENVGLKESLSKTNSDKIELEMDLKEARQSIVKWQDRVISVSDNLRTLRDQRDTARFIAALFGLAALGLAVAVLVGRLVPVVNLD